MNLPLILPLAIKEMINGNIKVTNDCLDKILQYVIDFVLGLSHLAIFYLNGHL